MIAGLAADALLIQEHHVVGEHACATIEASSARRRWRLSMQPAVCTPGGGASAGIAFAVVKQTGLAPSCELPRADAISHRLGVRHWGAVCRGCIHLLSIYLYDGEGLSPRNLDILQEVAFVVARLRGPWCLAGDFNCEPGELERSGWLQLVSGCIVAPVTPTCGEKVLDFFIVPTAIRHAVVAVQVLTGAGITPHSSVRLLLRADVRHLQLRRLKAPRRLPAHMPQGCLTEAIALSDVAMFDHVDTQHGATYGAAEIAACHVMGFDCRSSKMYSGRRDGISYAWTVAAPPIGGSQSRMSALALAWRVGSTVAHSLVVAVGTSGWPAASSKAAATL